MDFSDKTRIAPDVIARILGNPREIGLDPADLADKNPEQQKALIEGECLAMLASQAGYQAVQRLRASGHASPDWFDHRFHLLIPEEECLDFWTASADNVVFKLPMGGKVLDLCSGDGFYDYWFFRRRASEIVCVDIGPKAHRQAVRLHGGPGIVHHHANVLAWVPPAGHFDVVVCRGAIEHFSQANQQVIFRKAYEALKSGGWFCGDTPANPKENRKMLSAHENEWADANEMRAELAQVFPVIETSTLVSKQRTTLFWRAQRP